MSNVILGSSNSESGGFRFILKSLKFTLISYVISILLLAAWAILIVYTDVSEQLSMPVVKGITFFGAFLSALLASKTTGAKGWLSGLFTGAVNIVIIKLIGMALMGASIVMPSDLITLGAGAFFGMIGGIIGVNFGNN